MVSIIVPVFNAENYLKGCIDSILNQRYKDIEVILINDGSTDNSATICDDYLKIDNRIQVIHSKNYGPGVARNKGMELAKGKYISFVDADDTLMENSIEVLFDIAEKGQYDIVSGNYFRVKGETKVASNGATSGEISRNGSWEVVKRYNQYKTSSSFGYVWGKLYRKSFLTEHNLRFSQSEKAFMEDSLFNLKAFSFNPKYFYLDTPVYYYNILESSLSNIGQDITEEALKTIEDYGQFLYTEDKYDENMDLFAPLVIRIFCWAIMKNNLSKVPSYGSIYSIILKFSKSSEVKAVIKHKNTINALMKLPGVLEILFFTLCTTLLKLKLYRIIAVIFLCSYPLSKLYINKVVKN